MRVKRVESRNARQTCGPKTSVVAKHSSATVAAAAATVRQRNHQPELRLVGQKPEQDPGEKRPTVEFEQGGAEQSGGEKAVLAVTDVDQHRRKGHREEEPVAVPRRFGRNGRRMRAFFRRARRGGDDPPDRQDVEAKGQRLPNRERERIGQEGERGGDEEKERWIVPAVKRRCCAEDLLLAGVLMGRVERRCRVALAHIGAGRIDIGKVGSQGAAL
jgi:hypothetical protein